MSGRSRSLSEADRAVWAAYAQQLHALPGRAVPPPPASPAVLPPRPAPLAQVHTARPITRPLAIGDAAGGVDNATWQRFRSGKITPSRKLDLHGMTAQRAFQALVAFVRSAHAERLRCVEVVTGRGSGETGGVIRREFPLWLNLPDIRPLVLGASYPHAANPGAVRLLLRRIR
ncbi:MAG TPA: Smr/MutS family protein [Acetobacteraceae bacterium]|nr:Smr/MutS family protein [Acetobacteraceae bacterium]